MPIIKGIITDIASTICDKGTVVPLMAMRRAWRDFGVDVAYETLNYGMGSSKWDHIRMTQQLINQDKAYKVKLEKLMDRVEYNTVKILGEDKSHSVLFDDLACQFKTLQLKGFKIGHTTGYTSAMILPILQHWKQIHNYVPDAIVPSDEVAKGRPYPDAIVRCSERMLIPLRNCINIDDSEVGIKAGNKAKIPSFGVYQYGNWRGPLELELGKEKIHRHTYYDKISKGIGEEYEKMKNITEYVYPTTSLIMSLILEKSAETTPKGLPLEVLEKSAVPNPTMLLSGGFNNGHNKKLEILRHQNCYNTGLITYNLSSSESSNSLVIISHKTLTYTTGGKEGDDDFFINPYGGPLIKKGYTFTGVGGNYTITDIIQCEKVPNYVDAKLLNEPDSYDIIVKCNYTCNS